jgi:hypothetical protein
MIVVPLSQSRNDFDTESNDAEFGSGFYIRCAAAGLLIASGVLLVSGRRRAGLVAASSGTALALLDQKETLRRWWNQVPGYLDQAERMLDQVQETLDAIAVNHDRLAHILDQ